MVLQYSHEPFTNFKEGQHKKAFQESLAYVNTQLGKHYPLVHWSWVRTFNKN